MNKWDKLGIDISARMATMSKDPSTLVGACIMKGKFIVSQGYNGPPMGVKDFVMDRETRLARTLHAEVNAILTAKQDLTGCTIFVTHVPCSNCAAIIIQAGLTRVVYPKPTEEFQKRWGISIINAMNLFIEAGVDRCEYEEGES